jgi:general secretion pathway protein D
VRNVIAAALLCCGALGCSSPGEMAGIGPGDTVDPVRNADLTARFPPLKNVGTAPVGGAASGGFHLFPGLGGGDASRAEPQGGAGDAGGVAVTGGGDKTDAVEVNFDNADISTVAKAIVSDKLGLNVIVDPRVQGAVTLASASPIPRKELLSVFEDVLRMSNAAIVREGDLVKIVPLPDAAGAGGVNMSADEPGYGVTIIPLRYASAAAIAKTADNFLSRPGAVRVDAARNLLLVQGTAMERQKAQEMIASFDVEWLRDQSVGIFPLKSTSPDTMIHELERVFDVADGGRGQGVINFQPISRMNAVMAIAQNRRMLEQATQWVKRLDREDTAGTTVRIFRLEHGNATKIAKILNDIFVGRSGGGATDAGGDLAPGANGAQSKLDAVNTTSAFGNNAGSSASAGQSTGASAGGQMTSGGGSTTGGHAAASFDDFSDGKSGGKSATSELAAAFGSLPKGVFQSVRITADLSNNSIVVYSNEDDYRVIERSIRQLDRPQLQVGIDATIAEVTLTDALQYGVQYYLGSHVGSLSLTNSTTSTLNTPTVPGFNAVLGSGATPKAVLSALSTLTSVKVLSAPSLVVGDNQPAYLQVGDSIPISTGSATVLSAQNTIVNTTTYQDTGIILKVWPHVHTNGEVQLEIDQEVSGVVGGISPTGTTSLNPTLSERRVHSTVAVNNGQTVLLGGLISEEDDRNQSGVPILRQIKYLGDLFGTTNNSKMRTEIIVFVKPHIIDDALDAESVAEEFRSRLDTMRPSDSIIYGVATHSANGVKTK